MQMNTGEYWEADDGETDDEVWLFLIAAIVEIKEKEYAVALKCNWETKIPMIDDETHSQVWIFGKDGAGITGDFVLTEKQDGDGKNYLYG